MEISYRYHIGIVKIMEYSTLFTANEVQVQLILLTILGLWITFQ